MGACTSKTSKNHQTPGQKASNKQKNQEKSLDPQGLSQEKILINKFGELQSKGQARSLCSIPERNLLVALAWDDMGSTLYVYNTMKNFNLVATRKSCHQIDTIYYSKELKKILTGGSEIQLWDPKNFQVEMQAERHETLEIQEKNKPVSFVIYVPSSDVIVAKEGDSLCIYDRNLKYLSKFRLPTEKGKDLKLPWFMSPDLRDIEPSREEIVGVSKDLLLGVNHSKPHQVFLLNLQRKTLREYEHIFIPPTSCVAMTEDSPKKKIFTCLTGSLEDSQRKFKLTQFSINTKTEKLVISQMATEMTLSRLHRLENCKYLLGQNDANEAFLLSINKNQVETLCVLSKPGYDFGRYLLSNCTLLKDELFVSIERRKIKLYRFVRGQGESEKKKKSTKLYCS